ncbi:uncharacterized membrane protein YcjF (UPF0283 family) [Bradyrhizobium japonicum]
MNERSPPRRPATFRLDDPGVVVTEADETARLGRGTIQITPEHDPATLPVPIEAVLPARRGLPWGALFWSGLAGLTLLGVGLGVVHLIEDLFARSESLGFVGLAFAFVTALALAVVIGRERRMDWRASRRSRNCISAQPQSLPATTARRAASSCRTS